MNQTTKTYPELVASHEAQSGNKMGLLYQSMHNAGVDTWNDLPDRCSRNLLQALAIYLLHDGD